MVEIAHEQYSKDPSGFEKLLNDVEKPLYEGCTKFTKLSTLVKLYNLKVRHGWSNTSFSELLKALKDILLSPNDLPRSMYEAKKMLGALGMEYKKIHACPNSCCLYQKEYANAIVCTECSSKQPGDDIGIYLEPLINDLKLLWESEGCIAEGYILEEDVEFCSEFLCGVDPIGLDCQKLRDNFDNSELSRPLSSGVTSIPERKLLHQAHQYVLENTVDVQPYIELERNLQHEMLRFQITCGGLLMALIQFGGIKTDELGFVLVDLSRVRHKNDSFILSTQAKQVFFVEDPSDSRWSIILTPPQRDFEDQYNDDELGDIVLNCQGMPKATLNLDLIETRTLQHMYELIVKAHELLMSKCLDILKFNYRVLNDMQKKGPSEEHDFGRANMWKKARTKKKNRGYINEDVQQVANEIDEILDKSPNHESPNDALTQALSTLEYGGREKVLESVVKEKKRIATSVPPISLTSKKKVVEEKEVKEEEVIATRPSISKNEVKASRPMTKEVKITSEPSILPIQLKYILRYAERVMVDGSSFSFQLPPKLFGIPRKSYVLQEDVIDLCV
ncbi:uncharacterized protein E5676_scaffold172G00760 [Cucumis melo var. makuwa]|uniref:DUF4216 domain-containing protein n=1 Tax=Cucumis melo var. makuwa TaxID=1194695 RepID=A0A5D3E7L3_CUCMM|nr:uncharacterized protein E5676_scaffold172G00760 [Cucumis melo var. makuwa]